MAVLKVKYGFIMVWHHSPDGSYFTSKNRLMDKDTVKKSIAFLLDCYFTVEDNVFKQVISIPMGADPIPCMVNMFLYHYENKFINYMTNVTALAILLFACHLLQVT